MIPKYPKKFPSGVEHANGVAVGHQPHCQILGFGEFLYPDFF